MNLLPLVPLLPLAGFLALFATEGRLPKPLVAIVGAGSVLGSAICALLAGMEFMNAGGAPQAVHLWTWFTIGDFAPGFTLYLDGLSVVMLGVITGVGFLIHLYASGYMADEADYSRFFAYMNRFMFSMLMLVLGDNLLVLYLGWEGVGLCSYLLIGFFHRDPANGDAARKAFVVTRVGDTLMALGLFLLFREFGTLEIQAILTAAPATLADNPTLTTAIALLLLGGAVGKSAQLPLQTWLPDAMAGPTPVSALIHAATMVTAGVYLIARMNGIYVLSPDAQFVVALVGLVTLFVASFSALVQRDIKRILAYSTMSQIGYMFMALGVGAWSAAIFHLMTHAFFKALLFLSAGSVILALHHEQDIYRMGGLWKKLPIPFACMLVGSAALAALPFTSGYFSKDAILLTSFEYTQGGPWFWAFGSWAAFVTAMYCTRMILITFFGEVRTEPHGHDKPHMTAALLVLAVLAVGGGWFGLAPVAAVLPDGGLHEHHGAVAWLPWVTAGVPLLGIGVGWLLYRTPNAARGEIVPAAFARFWASGWGFDALYDALLVKPVRAIARLLKADWLDLPFTALAISARGLNVLFAGGQSGSLRWYAFNMGAGLVVALLLALVFAGLGVA